MKLGPWPHQRPRKHRGQQKQVSLWLPPDEWIRIRRHAAARHLPITAMIRELLQPAIDRLPEQPVAET